MSEKRRQWFQIHLSTAVVVMFVAGGLLHFNLTLRYAKRGDSSTYYLRDGESMFSIVRGWPLPVVKYWEFVDTPNDSSFDWAGDNRVFSRVKTPSFRITEVDPSEIKFTSNDPPEWSRFNLAVDVMAGLGVLALAALLLEIFSCRRNARTASERGH